MKIWDLQSDVNNFDTLVPIKREDWDKLIFAGNSLADSWNPVPVMINDEVKPSDIPGLHPSAPVLSEQAVESLKDLIKVSVEILPLKCRKGNYFVLNVVDVIDCIDYDNSVFKRFPDSNKIMFFEKYSFVPGRIQGKTIFKIVDEPTKTVFVSDVFKERVLSIGLKGFKFVLVWDSEGSSPEYDPFSFLKSK
jgi:hypothetical protein